MERRVASGERVPLSAVTDSLARRWYTPHRPPPSPARPPARG